MASYKELRAISVADKIEKKNGLSYLSWPFAVDTLLSHDAAATWEYGTPIMFGETMMVSCTVNAFGKSMTSHLPVMDHRNKAIPNPDAFSVNTAMQRCLVKAIALHGLGLYIYAGEDLPPDSLSVAADPRGDGHKEVPHAVIQDAVTRIRKVLDKDVDADAHCLELYAIHQDLSRDSDAYIAVADALAREKVISKADWKNSINRGRELTRKVA